MLIIWLVIAIGLVVNDSKSDIETMLNLTSIASVTASVNHKSSNSSVARSYHDREIVSDFSATNGAKVRPELKIGRILYLYSCLFNVGMLEFGN